MNREKYKNNTRTELDKYDNRGTKDNLFPENLVLVKDLFDQCIDDLGQFLDELLAMTIQLVV